jgi:hypothetical protein
MSVRELSVIDRKPGVLRYAGGYPIAVHAILSRRLRAMRPTRGDHAMIGLTFDLDRDAAKNSTIGHARWHWTNIKVVGRKLYRVERNYHPPSAKDITGRPPDFKETYEYRLDLIVTTPFGLEYAEISEESLEEELEEGSYRLNGTNA